MRLSARHAFAGAAAMGLLVALAASPHRPVGYVVRAGVHQARLLWGRVPLDEAAPALSADRRARLSIVPSVKEYAETDLGLVGRETYATIHPTWDHPTWIVTGCRPLAFEARTYWFPFVGSVPYLGFFDEPTARAHAERLERDGYETWVREAGTYSTLGWFDDPLLPGMLDWSDHQLADTLIHEIVHANVWVRGSVTFNESLANFVGEVGGLSWIERTQGAEAHAEAVAQVQREHERTATIAAAVAELEALYGDSTLPEDQKRGRKAAVLRSLPGPAEWNNARLLQFRTYHGGLARFRELYELEGRDLRRFVDRIRSLVEKGGDPWTALASAIGDTPEPVSGS